MKQNVGDYSFEYKKKQQVKLMRAVVFVVSVFVFISVFLNCILFSTFINSSSMETDVSKAGCVSFAHGRRKAFGRTEVP